MTDPIIITEENMKILLAKAMCYRGVGDPNALDINGSSRWLWYQEEANKFYDIYRYLIIKGEIHDSSRTHC